MRAVGANLAARGLLGGMTLITYRGRPVAMAGRERFALASHVAERRTAIR